MEDLKILDTQRAINLLCQMYLPCFDEEELCAIHTAIAALEEKKEIEEAKKSKKEEDTGGWDFHYDGHGDYEEQRRCFYGDFS